MAGPAVAFMSYARFDDQHDDGQLTAFRERLSAEIRVQTGEEFAIFQDRNDIAWGQNWQQRIDQALDAVTLLLVIITPGFFRSPACRAEVQRFLDRERPLGRDDLILPVYYVSTPELDDPRRRDADPLAGILAARQFADWRELRFEPAHLPGRPQGRGAARDQDARHVLAPARRTASSRPRAGGDARGAGSQDRTGRPRPVRRPRPSRRPMWWTPTSGAISPRSARPSRRPGPGTASWCGPGSTRKAWSSTSPWRSSATARSPTSRSTPATPKWWCSGPTSAGSPT